MINYLLSENVMKICLIAGQIKKKCHYVKMSYYLERSYSRNKIKVELDLSNYAAKSDVKNATGVHKSKFDKKIDSAT